MYCLLTFCRGLHSVFLMIVFLNAQVVICGGLSDYTAFLDFLYIVQHSGVYQNFGHFLVKWCAMSSTSDNGNFPKPGSSDVQGKAIEKKKFFQ